MNIKWMIYIYTMHVVDIIDIRDTLLTLAQDLSSFAARALKDAHQLLGMVGTNGTWDLGPNVSFHARISISIHHNSSMKDHESLEMWETYDINGWLVVWLPFFIFPYIGLLIIPIDFPIFQRGGLTTNQMGMLTYFGMARPAFEDPRYPKISQTLRTTSAPQRTLNAWEATTSPYTCSSEHGNSQKISILISINVCLFVCTYVCISIWLYISTIER